jgi:methylmalonyl-CoA/ethylmalonyl-CoA epimerase
MGMVIDHLGVVVRSLEQGIERWGQLFGYTKNSNIVANTRQRVKVVFLAKPGSLPIKLVEPSSEQSTVYQFARRGGGLHHICFRCENLDAEVLRLKECGGRLIVPAEPGEAFNNHDIAFMLIDPSLNIELIDTVEKDGWAPLH